MATEYEAAYPNVDSEEVRKKLVEVGAKKVRDMFLMKRITTKR